MRRSAFTAFLFVGLLASAAIQAAGPPDGFKLKVNYTVVAPDKATTIEGGAGDKVAVRRHEEVSCPSHPVATCARN